MQRNLLEAAMKKKGDSNESLAGSLNITASTLSRKKHGKSGFSIDELAAIKKRYKLTAEEMDEIFFT